MAFITIEELLRRGDAACSGMSINNPNRVLLQQYMSAVTYLLKLVPEDKLRTEAPAEQSRIVMP